jgi:hypothetical protein
LAHPKPQKGASIVMPNRCTLELTQSQLQKWARCSSVVFPKMFTFRENLSQVSLVPEDYNVTLPPPKTASPPHVATVYNKLTGGGGAGVSPSQHPAYLAPALCMFGLLSVVFSSSPVAPS